MPDTITEIGRAENIPAASLKIGDELLTAGSVKRLVTEPRVLCGYYHFDIRDLCGRGSGKWAVRCDTNVSVLRRP